MRARAKIFSLVVVFGVLISAATHAGEVIWPDRPPGLGFAPRIISERYSAASTNVLGSTNAIVAIKSAIAASKSNTFVQEIRWISNNLVMARVQSPEEWWYFVVEKKKGTWTVVTYYLKTIS